MNLVGIGSLVINLGNVYPTGSSGPRSKVDFGN